MEHPREDDRYEPTRNDPPRRRPRRAARPADGPGDRGGPRLGAVAGAGARDRRGRADGRPPPRAEAVAGPPAIPPDVQLVRFRVPEGVHVEILGPAPEPIALAEGRPQDILGLKVGVGYRLRIWDLPDRPGAELLPRRRGRRPPAPAGGDRPGQVPDPDRLRPGRPRRRRRPRPARHAGRLPGGPRAGPADRAAQGRDPDRDPEPGRGAAEGRLGAGAGDGDRAARGPSGRRPTS